MLTSEHSKKVESWMSKIFERNKDIESLNLEGPFKIEEVYPWNKLESLSLSEANIDWNEYPSLKFLYFFG